MSLDASQLEIIFANNCFAVAALVLICYDCVSTVAREAELIWTRHGLRVLRPPGLVYLLVRYTAIVGQIFLVIHLEPWKPLGSAEKCMIAVHIGDAMNVVNGLACSLFAVQRAYALSGRVLAALLVAVPCLLTPALFMAEAVGNRVLPIDTLGLDQCVGVLNSQSLAGSARNTYLATTIAASTGDFLTCALAIYKLGYSLRPSKSLSDALRWDAMMGLMTLALNMVVNVILVLVFDKVYNNPAMILFFRAWAILYPVFCSVSITNFILELQELSGGSASDVINSNTSTESTILCAWRDVALSTSGAVSTQSNEWAMTSMSSRDTSLPQPDPFPLNPETGSMAFDCSSYRDWEAELGEASFPAHFNWDHGPVLDITLSHSQSLYVEDSASTLGGVELLVTYP